MNKYFTENKTEKEESSIESFFSSFLDSSKTERSLLHLLDSPSKNRNKKSKIKCPSCDNGFMVKRKGKFSIFWGCSNYPNCKNTCPLGSFLELSKEKKVLIEIPSENPEDRIFLCPCKRQLAI